MLKYGSFMLFVTLFHAHVDEISYPNVEQIIVSGHTVKLSFHAYVVEISCPNVQQITVSGHTFKVSLFTNVGISFFGKKTFFFALSNRKWQHPSN